MKKKIVVLFMILAIIISGVGMLFLNINRIEGRLDGVELRENYNEYMDKLIYYTRGLNLNEEGLIEGAIEKLKVETNPLERGVYLNALSYYNVFMRDEEKHIEFGEEAIKEFDKAENGDLLVLENYVFMINNALHFNDLERALKYCSDALKKIETINDVDIDKEYLERFKLIIDCSYITIYANAGLIEKAREYYERIKDIDESHPLYSKNKGMLLYSKLLYNSEIENYEEQLKYTIKYQDYIVETNNPHSEGLRVNIAKALILCGREDEAVDHIKAAYEFYNNTEMYYERAIVKETIGLYYIEKEEYNEAFNIFNEAYKVIGNAEGFEEIKLDYIESIIKANKKGNLNKDVSYYMDEYVKINKEYKKNGEMLTLFKALEDINNKAYEGQLLIEEKDKKEIKKVNTNNRYLIVLLTCTGVLLVIFIIKLKNQIKKNHKYQKKLENIANKDYLTGAYTRYYGMKKVESLIKDGENFSLAIVDIDNFKKLNDTYGHLEGDAVLKSVSSHIMDKVSDVGTVIRYGGEEFLIVIESDINEAKDLIEEVRSDIEGLEIIDTNVTISGGISKWNGEEVDTLLGKVDKLLYKAKKNGKNIILWN